MPDTPATCAGTTFITTLDGYSASPPGTYSPTRSHRHPPLGDRAARRDPGLGLGRQLGRVSARARSIDSSSAARSGRDPLRTAAVDSTSAGTRSDGGRTPSNRSAASSTALRAAVLDVVR